MGMYFEATVTARPARPRIVPGPSWMPRNLVIPMYARGRVFKAGGTWQYEVLAGDRVIHADDGGTWADMVADCRRSTAAFSHVLFTGHRLKDKTWAAVIDRAMGKL